MIPAAIDGGTEPFHRTTGGRSRQLGTRDSPEAPTVFVGTE
jgi:hypothetical protein